MGFMRYGFFIVAIVLVGGYQYYKFQNNKVVKPVPGHGPKGGAPVGKMASKND